jgi:hypothetical protein
VATGFAFEDGNVRKSGRGIDVITWVAQISNLDVMIGRDAE